MSRPAADGPPTLEVAGATAAIRLRRPAEYNRIDPDDVAPGVVRSMKRQIDAVAAGDRANAESRSAYETSLASDELRRRLAKTGRQA